MGKNAFSQYITIDEFCSQLGVGRNKAYKILNDPVCRAVKIGNLWFIPYDSADRYIQEKIRNKQQESIWNGLVVPDPA